MWSICPTSYLNFPLAVFYELAKAPKPNAEQLAEKMIHYEHKAGELTKDMDAALSDYKAGEPARLSTDEQIANLKDARHAMQRMQSLKTDQKVESIIAHNDPLVPIIKVRLFKCCFRN
jgi:hypothetical protein